MNVLPIMVYGTLKNGFLRNNTLRSQRYLGITKTQPKYNLYSLGSYPGVTKNGETSITGELYEVDERCILELDNIEGTSSGLYERAWIDLKEIILSNLPVTSSVYEYLTNTKQAQTYFYLRDITGCIKLPNGFWSNLK